MPGTRWMELPWGILKGPLRGRGEQGKMQGTPAATCSAGHARRCLMASGKAPSCMLATLPLCSAQ